MKVLPMQFAAAQPAKAILENISGRGEFHDDKSNCPGQLCSKVNTAALAVLLMMSCKAFAEDPGLCQKIAQDAQRLKCYDQAFGRSDNKAGQADGAIELAPLSAASRSEETAQETKEFTRVVTQSGLSTYRPNYFLLYSYNRRRDTSLYPVSDLSYELDRPEAKFQISFKGPLWLDILGSEIDLLFGYTQLSFWQWFNTDLSSPFRESNYQPEAWFEQGFDFELIDDWKLSKVSVGFNHQSNGQEELLSRSWNRIISAVEVEKTFDYGARVLINLKSWKRLPEQFEDDDNPDITRFLGHSEITGIYHQGDHEVSLMVRNFSSHRRGVNLNWSFPIAGSSHVKGYLQFFDGYGESLIDYNHKNQTVGIGVTISDWL